MASQKFISSTEIDRKREAVRQARQDYLEQAEKKHQKDKQQDERQKQERQKNWMLPSISARVDEEEEVMKKAKKKKKEKKKKKKIKKHNSSSHDSDSENEEDGVLEWKEKRLPSVALPGASASTGPRFLGPQLQRDSWMEAPMDIIPTISRQEIRDRKKKEEDAENEKKILLPGHHERELNPYWHDGGTGLPSEKQQSEIRKQEKPQISVSGDGGLSWLQKALQRCKDQAAEEGRSLEEVATERWGSLKKLESMIAEAEKAKKSRNNDMEYHRSAHCRSRSPISGGCRSGPRDRDSDERDSFKDRGKDRNFERKDSRSRFMKPGEDEDMSHRHRTALVSNREVCSNQRMFIKPRETRQDLSGVSSPDTVRKDGFNARSESSYYKYSDERSAGSSSKCDSSTVNKSEGQPSGQFLRPGERNWERSTGQMLPEANRGPRWKKPEYCSLPEGNKAEVELDIPKRQRSDSKQESPRSKRQQDSNSSSESSCSSDESTADDEKHLSADKRPSSPIRILTEDELNALGAKLVRAELMGDEERIAELKQQLESARTVREKHVASGGSTSRHGNQTNKSEHDEVILTRTSKTGVIYPLPEEEGIPATKGKSRKAGKVTTHGKGGERLQYFDDDDKFDLKELVAREKMGTAEDQNAMFARLAERATSQLDDDFQTDDLFLERAASKQSKAKQEEKDRAQSIFEHRKMTAAMDKCPYCFNNVPKHLIVAIGTKVYLCLPNFRSLTEGHCQIVPMQHVASGTTVDEDVWQEMQTFRKCLVQMFASQEEDCVFMETVTSLRRFPHAVIDCVPLEKELGDVAPIYFKKAIQECETEWSDNKKLVDLSKKDVRHSIPKGFPYFSVDFGLQGGFAHVIEDEARFPNYFGKEVLGGMMDCDTRLWRKPQRENFDTQRQKVLNFEKMWKPFDWTQKLLK